MFQMLSQDCVGPSVCSRHSLSVPRLVRKSYNRLNALRVHARKFSNVSGASKDDPRSEWLQSFLTRFGPITGSKQSNTVLDFEKPLIELDNRILEVRRVAEENGVDVSNQIKELEERARQLRKDTYSRLTPAQRLAVARHPNRPTFLDVVLNITEKFVELHGDRAGYDDPAIVCGLGTIEGIPFMFIGQQKGRNTKENVYRNFGMPHPNGYRKALRFMRHADKFGFPILTFVDTPGAFAGRKAEELGQGEAIAVNLREMFGLRVPVISLVIGEGGSGGALAIGCGNRMLIMENAVYYVASPEACAAILWKSREKAGLAAEALKITAKDLVNFGVMDEIVPEPLGGAHNDPMGTFPFIKEAILRNYQRYVGMEESEIMLERHSKFRNLGAYEEFLVFGGQVEAAREERAKSPGFYTQAGTWAASEEEARYIEHLADQDEKRQKMLQDKRAWLNPPEQPPGLSDGTLYLAIAAVELRRRQIEEAVARGEIVLDDDEDDEDEDEEIVDEMIIEDDEPGTTHVEVVETTCVGVENGTEPVVKHKS